MSKPSRVLVLVEDLYHEMLVRRCLILRGLRTDQFRIHRSPSGRGNAEGWVRREFAKEIKEYRRRQASAQSGLIVMIDADTHTVQERWTQLDRALADNDQRAVGRLERIARLVPKRNVETRILCLNDERDLDEDTDYTRRKHEWHELIPTAAVTLRDWTRPKAQLPAHCVSSLRLGVKELKRLDS